MEAKNDIGGLWNKSEDRERTQRAIKELYGEYTAEVYEGLYNNGPYICMEFRDMPSKRYSPDTLVPATEFLEDLHAYADRFRLREHMRFDTTVTKVRLAENLSDGDVARLGLDGEDRKFRYALSLKDTSGGDVSTDKELVLLCNYVVCCNGLHITPNYPKVENPSLFKGDIMHAEDFTDMESLRKRVENKRIAIVGGLWSGRDIINSIVLGLDEHPPINVKSIDFVITPKSMMDTYKKAEGKYKEHEKIVRPILGPFTGFTGPNTLETKDGSIDADVVIYTTGYNRSLPFIDPKDDILAVEIEESKSHYVRPLYLRTFSANQPSFALVTIPFELKSRICVDFERQICVIAAVFSGRTKLPNKEAMTKYVEDLEHRLKSKSKGVKKWRTDIPGVNDIKDMYNEWFEASGLKERNFDIDEFMDKSDKTWYEFVNNGNFFTSPQIGLKGMQYDGPMTSDKF